MTKDKLEQKMLTVINENCTSNDSDQIDFLECSIVCAEICLQQNKEKSIKFLEWFMGDDENSCPFELYKKHTDNEITSEELYHVFEVYIQNK